MGRGRKADKSDKAIDRQLLRAAQGEERSLKQMLASFDDLRFAVLATSDQGRPYASLVAFAFTPDCKTVILATLKATRKYRNIRSQGSVSILIDNRSQTPEDLSRAEAVTLVGTARPIRAGARKEKYSKVFSDKHPQLTGFINQPGTALVAVDIEQAIHVTRFQDVSAWIKKA
jgi:nitroimidazol reductase NimA-like FMN-containing flavoprotein (pyridoxamine 5'-phosphate oxidase superfamily)